MAKDKFGSYGLEYELVLVGTIIIFSYLCHSKQVDF